MYKKDANKGLILYIALMLYCSFFFINNFRGNYPIIFVNNYKLIKRYNIEPDSFCKINKTINYIPNDYLVSLDYIDNTVPKEEVVEVKFFHENDNLKLIKCFDCEKTLNNNMPIFKGIVAHVSDVYTNHAGSVVTLKGEFIYLDPDKDHFEMREHLNGPVIKKVENVIALGHRAVFIYSHWFYDFLAPLTLFPDYLIKNSIILVSRKRQLCEETLEVFGVKPENIISVNKEQWVFAQNVYFTYDPCPHISHFGTCMNKLAKKMHNYFHLEQIKAEKYCLSNRKAGYRRHFLNFNELVDVTRKQYKDVKIEVVDDEQNHLVDTAKLWASAKLMFMPTGSNFIKSLFMHKGSVCVVALSFQTQDDSICKSACAHGVYVLYFIVLGMEHHSNYKGSNCPIPLAVKCIGIGLDCAKNGHWGKKKMFYDCSNKNVCV